MLSGREGCTSRLGSSAGVGRGCVVVGRRSLLSLVKTLLPANQEMMGQHDHRHVMVPPAPEAQLIVIHAQFPFAFGKTRLNGPAHATDPHKRGKRRLQWGITQVKLPLWLFWQTTDFAPDDHPDFWT